MSPEPTPSELANVLYGLERLVMREWSTYLTRPQDDTDLRRARLAVTTVVYRLRQDSDAARVLGVIQ